MLKGGKQIVSALSIKYSIKPVEGDWKLQDTSSTGKENHLYIAFEYTRIATAQYEYIGYDLDTAKEMKKSFIKKYNRLKLLSTWKQGENDFIDGISGHELMADITMQQIKGHMYKIIVNVHEEDRKMMKTAEKTAAVVFALENTREYEE